MVKPRENRVPIMMSDDELKAIDDWRFANRVATRSDAVRRLAQIALRTNTHLGGLVLSTAETLNRVVELNEKAAELIEKLPEASASARVGALYFEEIGGILEAQILTREQALNLAQQLLPFVEDSSLEEAIGRSDSEREQAKSRWTDTVRTLQNARKGIEL